MRQMAIANLSSLPSWRASAITLAVAETPRPMILGSHIHGSFPCQLPPGTCGILAQTIGEA